MTFVNVGLLPVPNPNAVAAAEADVDRRAAVMARGAQQVTLGRSPRYRLTAEMVRSLLPQLPLGEGQFKVNKFVFED